MAYTDQNGKTWGDTQRPNVRGGMQIANIREPFQYRGPDNRFPTGTEPQPDMGQPPPAYLSRPPQAGMGQQNMAPRPDTQGQPDQMRARYEAMMAQRRAEFEARRAEIEARRAQHQQNRLMQLTGDGRNRPQNQGMQPNIPPQMPPAMNPQKYAQPQPDGGNPYAYGGYVTKNNLTDILR